MYLVPVGFWIIWSLPSGDTTGISAEPGAYPDPFPDLLCGAGAGKAPGIPSGEKIWCYPHPGKSKEM